MTDFSYSLLKDNTKTVPLYHHEQVPFQSFYNNNNNNTRQQSTVNNNSTMKAVDQTGDLQDIIYSYQSQPELLKLILSSKLEEDKRRAEEAKLRAKELDLLLLQQHQMSDYNNEEQNDFSTLFPTTYHIQPTPPISQSSSTDGYHQLRRTSLDAILSNSNPLLPQHNRRDSNLGSSFTTDSDDLDDKTFSPIPSNTSSTLLHMER
jgi:hypothetical protein